MLDDDHLVNSLEPVDVATAVEDPQTMETALQDSGNSIRKNLVDGFLGYLASAEHVYLRKCDVERVTGSLERYVDWLQSLRISARTGRRMCAFYLDLKVIRTDILAIVDLLYLRNVKAIALQKVIKLDEDKKNGVDTGNYVRSECKANGIFLYFTGADDDPYDLAQLSTRQIDALAFPEKVAKTSSATANAASAPKLENVNDQESGAAEGGEGEDDDILRLKQLCEELEQTVLDLKTELSAYQDTVPRAMYDELQRKFYVYQQHMASEKKKLRAESAGDAVAADMEYETDIGYGGDEQIGVLGFLDSPGHFDSVESILAF
jgi:hypothetical protein